MDNYEISAVKGLLALRHYHGSPLTPPSEMLSDPGVTPELQYKTANDHALPIRHHHITNHATMLPSIKDMLSHAPHHQQQQEIHRFRNQQHRRNLMPYNPYPKQRPITILHQEQIRLAGLENHDEVELQALFENLRKYHREEYAKEIENKRKDACCSDEDMEDNQSSHSSSDNCSDMNEQGKHKLKSGSDKPRWTAKEKADLFEAIIKQKTLSVMGSFDWSAIGSDIGRSDKACKDQWRRGILKFLRESFHRDD